MLTKKEDVLKKLDELKIDYELMEHEAVYTIEEMKNLNMPRIDEVIKNLFVRDEKKQNYYLYNSKDVDSEKTIKFLLQEFRNNDLGKITLDQYEELPNEE